MCILILPSIHLPLTHPLDRSKYRYSNSNESGLTWKLSRVYIHTMKL